MKKVLLIEKRKKAKGLFKNGWSIRKISRHLVASKDSVCKWVKLGNDEVSQDKRGWKKSKPRKYTKQQKEGTCSILNSKSLITVKKSQVTSTLY